MTDNLKCNPMNTLISVIVLSMAIGFGFGAAFVGLWLK